MFVSLEEEKRSLHTCDIDRFLWRHRFNDKHVRQWHGCLGSRMTHTTLPWSNTEVFGVGCRVKPMKCSVRLETDQGLGFHYVLVRVKETSGFGCGFRHITRFGIQLLLWSYLVEGNRNDWRRFKMTLPWWSEEYRPLRLVSSSMAMKRGQIPSVLPVENAWQKWRKTKFSLTKNKKTNSQTSVADLI